METWGAAVTSWDGAPQPCARDPFTWHLAKPWGHCRWSSTQAKGPEGSCCPCPLLTRVCLPLRGACYLLLSAQQGHVGQGRPGPWAGGRLSVVRCTVVAVPWTGCCPFLLPAARLWAFGVGPQLQPHPCEDHGSLPAGVTFRRLAPRGTCSCRTWWWSHGKSRCCCAGRGGPGSPPWPALCTPGQVLFLASSSW